MIIFFSVVSLVIFLLAFLIVLNFWKYRYKGDRTPLFVVILFLILIGNSFLTVSYLIGNNVFSGSDDQEYWDNN